MSLARARLMLSGKQSAKLTPTCELVQVGQRARDFLDGEQRQNMQPGKAGAERTVR